MRQLAAAWLGRSSAPGATSALLDLVRADAGPRVRQAAAQGLASRCARGLSSADLGILVDLVDRRAPSPDGGVPSPAAAPASGVSIDPVCGMQVNEAEARAAGRVSEHAGRTIYFCNTGCKQRFDANPAAFLAKAGPAGGRAAAPSAERRGEQRHD